MPQTEDKDRQAKEMHQGELEEQWRLRANTAPGKVPGGEPV